MKGTHEIGEVVAGRYRITSTLGVGGVGVTYAAADQVTGMLVALKQLRLWHEHDWKVLELFQREAQVLAELEHPGIPRYLHHFQVETETGTAFYLAQTLAEGTSLRQLRASGWQAGEDSVRRIAAHLLDVLEYLHARSPAVVHRDVKPDNVLRRPDGHVYLVDFGAVRDLYRTNVTEGSTVVGTFGYMAPEQYRGHAVPATDLYGLGATLVFLLTGRSPAELPQRSGRVDLRRSVKASPALTAWLQRLLESDPERRYPNARAARQGLAREDRARRFSPRRLALMLGLAAALAAPGVYFAALALGPLEPGTGGQVSVSGAQAGGIAPSKKRTPGYAEKGRLKYVKLLEGHWAAVFSARFAGDSRSLLTGSVDGSLKLWNLDDSAVVRAFPVGGGRVGGLAVTEDGKQAVTGTADGKVRFWEVGTGKELGSFQASTAELTTVALSADAKYVAATSLAGEVRLFDRGTHALVMDQRQQGRVVTAAFTPDSRVLAAAGKSGAIVLYDVERRALARTLTGHTSGVSRLAISSDSVTLVSAGGDRTLRVWALASGVLVRTLETPDDEIWALALHPDGKTVATGSEDGTVRLWDVYTGALVEHAFGDRRGVIAAEFSPDGRRLVTTGGGSFGLVWDFMRPSWRPPVVSSPVRAVAPEPEPTGPVERRLVARANYLMGSRPGYTGTREALPLLEQALAANAKDAATHAALSRAKLRLGYLSGQEYRPEAVKEALAYADRAIELDPELPVGYVRKAWACLAAKDLAGARAMTAKLRERWPTDPHVLVLHCELAEREGNPEELLAHARTLVEQDPEPADRVAAYAYLTSAYRMRGEWDAVDETWRSQLNLSPDSAWTRGNYAQYLVGRERFDEAIQYAEEARKLMDYPAAAMTLADAFAGKALEALRSGDRVAADGWLDKAEAASRNSADTAYARGAYAEANGELGAARRSFERALKLKPKHERAREALERLTQSPPPQR